MHEHNKEDLTHYWNFSLRALFFQAFFQFLSFSLSLTGRLMILTTMVRRNHFDPTQLSIVYNLAKYSSLAEAALLFFSFRWPSIFSDTMKFWRFDFVFKLMEFLYFHIHLRWWIYVTSRFVGNPFCDFDIPLGDFVSLLFQFDVLYLQHCQVIYDWEEFVLETTNFFGDSLGLFRLRFLQLI